MGAAKHRQGRRYRGRPVSPGPGGLGGRCHRRAAAGALHHNNLGLTDADKARLTVELTEGKAAVGVMAHFDPAPAISDRLTQLGGTPETHELTDEAIEAAARPTERQCDQQDLTRRAALAAPASAAVSKVGAMRRWAGLVVLLLALSAADVASAKVAKPRFVRNIATGETGWFSSPGLVDLAGDKKLEIVAPFYTHVRLRCEGPAARQGHGDARAGLRAAAWSPTSTATASKEIVVGGNDGTGGRLRPAAPARCTLKPGWPASTCSGGQCPETRGLAAADLDGDGRVEVVATTTNTAPDSGAQVFVFDRSGAATRPAGRATTPRDATLQRRRQPGLRRVRGERRDRAARRRPAARDRRHLRQPPDQPLQPRRHVGARVALVHEPRRADYAGARLGWGQFIRWLEPEVEDDHYHRHTGDWPDLNATPWLQWTASPPSIADLDRDGKNEVIGVPNVEMQEPYETQAYAFMVLDGAYGDGLALGPPAQGLQPPPAHQQARGAPRRRLVPAERHPRSDARRPPRHRRPEIVAPIPDGRVYADQPDGQAPVALRLRPRRARAFASEVVAADLNRDGRPSSSSGPTAWRPTQAASSCSPPREDAVRAPPPPPGINGNGIGIAPPRRSPTSTATASSRSW